MIWGGTFLFMRIAAPHFGALALVEVRVGLGALTLLPVLWRDRQLISRSNWRNMPLIAATNSAIPFALIAWNVQRAPAGVSAIANGTMVMFTALVGAVLYRERITTLRKWGLLVGFLGIVLLSGAGNAGIPR